MTVAGYFQGRKSPLSDDGGGLLPVLKEAPGDDGGVSFLGFCVQETKPGPEPVLCPKIAVYIPSRTGKYLINYFLIMPI